MKGTDKEIALVCPSCNQTGTSLYVTVQRTVKRHTRPVLIESTEDGETFRYMRVDNDPDEEVIDSMGNDEYMECQHCGHHWRVPEVDDICDK